MSTVKVLIGAPGVGKSTWREHNVGEDDVVLSTDDMIDAFASIHGITYAEAWHKINQKQIKRDMKAIMLEAIENNQNIIVDRTNMTVKNRKEFLRVPETYRKVAVVWSLTDAEHTRRLKARVAAGGKSVPDFVIRMMLNSYQAPSREEGFDEIRWVKN